MDRPIEGIYNEITLNLARHAWPSTVVVPKHKEQAISMILLQELNEQT